MDRNDYYPFGMNFVTAGAGAVYDAKGSPLNYKFGTKELQETGFYDFGARMLMPDIGRWFTVDPLAEKNTRFTPYHYAANNPIRNIDPDGRLELNFTGEAAVSAFIQLRDAEEERIKRNAQKPPDDHFNQFGKFLYTDKKKTNNIIIDFQNPITGDINTAPWLSRELKDFEFNKDNLYILANIAKHYAEDAGVNVDTLYNGDFSVGAFNNVSGVGLALSGNNLGFNDGKFWGMTEEGAIPMMHTDGNKVTIDVYNNRIADNFLNDKYNFISVLGHEGSSRGHVGLPNAKHSTIYENQKQRPLFKYTTPEFKKHVDHNIKFYKSNGN